MRDAFNASVDRSNASLAGAKCEVDYTRWKDIRSIHPWLPSTIISIEIFKSPLTLGPDGKIVIPEALFAVMPSRLRWLFVFSLYTCKDSLVQ